MKEHSLAVSVSLLFHIIIVSLFLWIPFDQYVKPKLMVLDFSIEKGRMTGHGQEEKVHNQKTDLISQQAQHEKQVAEKTIARQDENTQREADGGTTAGKGKPDTVVSDPAGSVAVHGQKGITVEQTGSFSGKNASASMEVRGSIAASGDRKVIDYSKSDSVPKELLFIGDILKNRFRNTYPDRARRMGWEGEVRLSCTISENGTVQDIKIVESSGRSIFDDHAREIMARTTFGKLPYSLPIIWRTIYQLQN